MKDQDYVFFDNKLLRPSEIMVGSANPNKAKKLLGWEAKYDMHDIVKIMIEDELEKIKGN